MNKKHLKAEADELMIEIGELVDTNGDPNHIAELDERLEEINKQLEEDADD
jgi:hypothetical protein